jgi:endonuclease-3 related protein
MNNPAEIYSKLLSAYGKQGWWPATPEGKTSPVYGLKQHTKKQKLEIIFGAILTQNTSWKNAEKAITELNKKNLINTDKIIEITENELAQLIKSAGYYNQKAKRLKNVCTFLKQTPGIEKKENARELLLAVNGIGNETADSILLYAFSRPAFVIDAYTKRIFSRIGMIKKEADCEEAQKIFSGLEKNTEMFSEYHALIVEHAKKHCRKNPKCEGCVIKEKCKTNFLMKPPLSQHKRNACQTL